MLRALRWIEGAFGVCTFHGSTFVLAQAAGSQSVEPGRSMPQPARTATIAMARKFEELVFLAPTPVLRCWAGFHCTLCHGVLRFSDLLFSMDLYLTEDALVGTTWRMKRRIGQVATGPRNG